MSAQLKCIPINHGWEFKEADRDDTFLPVSQFPTTNHLDLLHHGRIPDPTQDRNREAVQWVGERPWLYKTSFEYDEGGTPRAVLVFKGLDTHCSIVLNGELLLKTNDMFLEYTSEVTGKLKMGMNDLELRFESTFLVGKQLEKAQGFKNLFWNGDSSRMNVRKVPCHYGWDWGPTLMTCGPWRPISLLVYEARILDLSVDIEVSDGLDYAILTVQNEIEGGNNMRIEVSVKDASGTQVATRSLQGNATCRFTINSPVLWYPVGYGAQHLYMVEARLYGPSGESCLDFMSHKVGIRLLELVQRPIVGQSGSTFFFRVNNIPIYCQGTNWIPPDTFLPRMTAEKYREWLQLAVKSNQNMIRVWGGGLYEEDSFYDTCDELGILIWQDFMLGCGSYPVNDELLTAIKREAIYNVKRLRQHPCKSRFRPTFIPKIWYHK
jgi:beta-mannosidase